MEAKGQETCRNSGGRECHQITFFSLAVWECGVAPGDLEGNVMLVKETFSGMRLEHRAGSKILPANLLFPPRGKSFWH